MLVAYLTHASRTGSGVSSGGRVSNTQLQFSRGTLGHPLENAPGAVANRVAQKTCVQARNGRDLARKGNEIMIGTRITQ